MTVDGESFDRTGLRSVFSCVSDFCYAPGDATITVTSTAGGAFALPSGRCTRRLPPRYGPAEAAASAFSGTATPA